MKLSNIKAWGSTILGFLLILAIIVGVALGKLTNEALACIIPLVSLLFTNVFKEKKGDEDQE